MTNDLPPELIDNDSEETLELTLEEAVAQEDENAQIGPEELSQESFDVAFEGATQGIAAVKWPDSDADAPDFSYIANETASDSFVLNAEVLEKLILLNRYEPYREKNIVAFALRGAALTSGHEAEATTEVTLSNVRPDHRQFRCVIGFYFQDTKKISVYTGSTVPCRLAVWSYKNGGSPANMLPTGMHTFYVWRHKTIRPALRLGKSSRNPESGSLATVLRNKNNYSMEMKDLFDLSTPLDNVHCSYYLNEDSRLGASFSSWGCLTVRGTKDPSDQWEKFQNVLDTLAPKTRVDLLLATGKDAALASSINDEAILEQKLAALRRGSRGSEVKKLQEKLGLEPTGYFGAETLDKFTGFQRGIFNDAGLGKLADGIYSIPFDDKTGWNLLQNDSTGNAGT